MSYTKYTWETGEVITAAKLNNMEDGIDDKLIVNMLDAETGELDVSYADLLAAWTAKKQVILFYDVLGEVTERKIAELCTLAVRNSKYTAFFTVINSSSGSVVSAPFVAETDSEHLACDPDD